FQFLFYFVPLSVVVFLAWAVGESYARERWGERLASFDAILRRDPLNATVGRSVLTGLLTAPAVAAAALLIAWIPMLAGLAHPALGGPSRTILSSGSIAQLVYVLLLAIVYAIVALLFVLSFSNSRRLLPIGIAASVAVAMIGNVFELPMGPYLQQILFGFGGMAAVVAVFLTWDLLAATVAFFFGEMLVSFLPLLHGARGPMASELWAVIAVPLLLTLLFAGVARLTSREVTYTYEDLAPHVKRIVERERVKAEIDAANRIQAALLPLEPPTLAGASFASHYRAATEIGGDYFDFLPQPTGEIGIAFGDVSGHGLTSGIVMAMAKAALLVQVDYDASPRAVLSVLNEIVIKTAPKRILMTFFFGLLDPATHTLRFSSAGHLDPYVFRAADKRIEPLSSWGFPLGVRRREAFREHSVEFVPGDRLILYSDGLIEAVDDDGEPYGFERFEQTIRGCGHLTADEIKKALLASVKKFTRNRPPEDDQTLVVVGFEEIPAGALPPIAGHAGLVVAEPVN
ncbi:MAG: Serine phosphatase RsbU, regulator of sigma subunit, partial [Acidobacteria bacterium]|nr:Serine phosphatase RsbU, regulator of sigma subunit [Acidobacteriota bacterium]